MRQILLIIIGLSIVANADFTKSGNIVTDSATGLQWQDNEVGNRMMWEEAIRHCEELELDNYSDWRVPNINELKTIIDRSRYNPAIVEEFENTESYKYWSSTTGKFNARAWGVMFYSGTTYDYGDKNDDNFDVSYVRCVRVGQ